MHRENKWIFVPIVARLNKNTVVSCFKSNPIWNDFDVWSRKWTTKTLKVITSVSGLNGCEWKGKARVNSRNGQRLAFRKWYSRLPVYYRPHKPSPPAYISLCSLLLFASLSDTVSQRQNMSLLLLSCLGALQSKSSLSVSVCGFGKQLLHSLITMQLKWAGLKQTPSLHHPALSLSNTKAGHGFELTSFHNINKDVA